MWLALNFYWTVQCWVISSPLASVFQKAERKTICWARKKILAVREIVSLSFVSKPTINRGQIREIFLEIKLSIKWERAN